MSENQNNSFSERSTSEEFFVIFELSKNEDIHIEERYLSFQHVHVVYVVKRALTHVAVSSFYVLL
jgi:hypothetical protein